MRIATTGSTVEESAYVETYRKSTRTFFVFMSDRNVPRAVHVIDQSARHHVDPRSCQVLFDATEIPFQAITETGELSPVGVEADAEHADTRRR